MSEHTSPSSTSAAAGGLPFPRHPWRVTLPAMGRRTWGTGGLHQRASDGRWIGSVSLGNGRRQYVTGTDPTDVRRRLRDLLRSSTSPLPDTESVTDFLTRWLADAQVRLRPLTVKRYRSLIGKHVIPAIGDVSLSALTPREVQLMVTGVLRAGYAPQTAVHVLSVMRAALATAVNWEVLDRNVARMVQPPRVPRKDPHPLTAADARRFLSLEDRDHALYVLALTTGMRQGELLGLRWPDLDLTRGTVTVRHSLRQIDKYAFEWDEPKTPRSRRTLPLSQLAIEALNQHKSNATSATVVFARPDGRPLDKRHVNRRFQAALVRAGLKPVPFHTLRHWAAAFMLEESHGDLRLVMGMLGHSTITTTVDRYGGIAEQARKRAAEGMDRILTDNKADTEHDKGPIRAENGR